MMDQSPAVFFEHANDYYLMHWHRVPTSYPRDRVLIYETQNSTLIARGRDRITRELACNARSSAANLYASLNIKIY
jgi:hypothetical protein